MTDFEYAIHDGHIEIVKYTGTVSEVLIPSTIDGLPVTHIGDSAFSWCNNLTIVGRSETAAEWYANKEGIPFQKTDQACQLPPS